MPRLQFQDVSKSFGPTRIIEKFNATVEDGEFVVLLGPSGCGKSTLLRMIAGLTPITSGQLRFEDEAANDWSPRKRGVAFVFQTYALYPHMTVRGNISFPLVMDAFRSWHHIPFVNAFMRWRMTKNADIARKTERIARQLELDPLLDRRPASLSGGQRQRVALARALIRDPSLYLLDEPLSNLDAKLRIQMRSEISALHNRVGKTFIYVTHDQVEAMTMATRIIVMDKGVVQQVGSPQEIYDNPANTFVARFVGSPPMNLLPADDRGATLMGIRPEKIALRLDESGRIKARIAVVERLGAETIIGCRPGADEASARLTTDDLVFVKQTGNPALTIGAICSVDFADSDIVWFDAASGQRIERGV